MGKRKVIEAVATVSRTLPTNESLDNRTIGLNLKTGFREKRSLTATRPTTTTLLVDSRGPRKMERWEKSNRGKELTAGLSIDLLSDKWCNSTVIILAFLPSCLC